MKLKFAARLAGALLAAFLAAPVQQAAAENGPTQVGLAVWRGAADSQAVDTGLRQLGLQGGNVERRVDRVARRGVGGLERQVRRGRQPVAGATKTDAGRGEAPQVGPTSKQRAGRHASDTMR